MMKVMNISKSPLRIQIQKKDVSSHKIVYTNFMILDINANHV
jgi:hypothetical protein